MSATYYEELFSALNEAGVAYLLIGGVAAALHGALRVTADLDLLVQVDAANVEKFVDLMSARGFQKKELEKLEVKAMVEFSWRNPKKPERLVNAFVEDPGPFDALYRRRVTMRAGAADIPVVSIPDLIAMKEKTGGPQDLADLEALRLLA